jgi:lambda repressor-like predicted transcriptional regulator
MKIEIKKMPGAETVLIGKPLGAVSLGRGRNRRGMLILADWGSFIMRNDLIQKDLKKNDVIPALIKSYLKARGLTGNEFARESGFSLSTVRSWTAGRRFPRMGVLFLLIQDLENRGIL